MFPRSFRCHFYVSFSLRFNTPIYLYRSLELGRSLIVMMLLFRCRPILSVSQIPLLLLLAWRSHLIILARGICFSFIPSDAAGLSFRRRTKLLRPLIFYLHCMSDLSCYSFHFFRMRFFFFASPGLFGWCFVSVFPSGGLVLRRNSSSIMRLHIYSIHIRYVPLLRYDNVCFTIAGLTSLHICYMTSTPLRS